MIRNQIDEIRRDLDGKLVLLSGPRQVGKTTLSKQLFPNASDYFNYDSPDDINVLKNQAWRKDVDLVIFDELHKMKKWKAWIKGVFDTQGVRPRLIVTGSARLDVHKKGGESLAGRFHSHRLHPFSVAEVASEVKPEEALDRLLRFGGFPEPFLKASTQYVNRWRKSHGDRIIRGDLLDLEQIRDIKSIEYLIELLRQRVGSPISYASLGEDLQKSPHTIKRWITALEMLYVVFVVRPYSKSIARSILKQPKIYFYDTGQVKDDMGARLENTVACALLKRVHFLEDVNGDKAELFFVRDKQEREVDFLTVVNNKPEWLVETKVADTNVSSSLRHFSQKLAAQPIQVVKDAKRELHYNNLRMVPAASWLAKLET